jgi:drug/metabolite transporter (DMT)-like permease
MAAVCSALGHWPTIAWEYWPAFIASIVFGIVLGNLAMVECLRLGGPRRTEILLALKAPLVAIVAFFWLGERPAAGDLVGSAIVLLGVMTAVFFGSNVKSDSDRPRGALIVVVLLGVASAGFQGFGFLAMKPAMQAGTEPIAASTVRLLGAALLISLIALWPSKRFHCSAEISPRMLGRTILPGFIGYGVSSSLLLYAFAKFDAGIATVLGSLSPIFVLPVLWLKEGVPPRLYAVLGAFLAIAGTGIIVIF